VSKLLINSLHVETTLYPMGLSSRKNAGGRFTPTKSAALGMDFLHNAFLIGHDRCPSCFRCPGL